MIQLLFLLVNVCLAQSLPNAFNSYIMSPDNYKPKMYYMESLDETYGLNDTIYASFDGRLTTVYNPGMQSVYFTWLYPGDLLPHITY